jgi:hypothetical protein
MANYRLINPCIEGDMKTTFSGNTPLDAAFGTWNAVSKYITNNVPHFAFTMENTKTGKMHHFAVKESLVGGGSAEFDITEINKVSSANEKELKKRIASFEKSSMRGGKKHKKHDDDDDSSSSSSSEVFSALKLFKKRNQVYPIAYWWYDPLVYNFNSLYIPTFVAPLAPHIELTTINYV